MGGTTYEIINQEIINQRLAKRLATLPKLNHYLAINWLADSFDSPTPLTKWKHGYKPSQKMKPENETINWSSMARTFNISNKKISNKKILAQPQTQHSDTAQSLDAPVTRYL